MFTTSVRSFVATTSAVALAIAGLVVLVGTGGSASAHFSTQFRAQSSACSAQAEELTDSGLAAQDAAKKVVRAKKRLRKAKRANQPAKVKVAKRKLKVAKKELRLQLEWYTDSKAAYDTCMQSNPTPTATPTSSPTATATSTSTDTPTATSTTSSTTTSTATPTASPTVSPPVCVPNPLPGGPSQICVPG